MVFKMKPRATSENLTNFGTDYVVKGRFQDTLVYNHFLQEDFKKLHVISEKMKHLMPEMVTLFVAYLKECSTRETKPVSEQAIQEYLTTFLTYNRTEEYVDQSLIFFPFVT